MTDAAAHQLMTSLSRQSRPAVLNVQARKEFWLREQPPGFLGKIEPGVMSYYH